MANGEKLDTFGGRLRAARKAKRLSQVQLGALAGIHQTQVSDLENDEYEGSAFVAELAHALEVEALWLKTGKGARKRTTEALNVELLEDVIYGVEWAATKRSMTLEKKARMIAAVYQSNSRTQTKPEPAEILAMLRAMSEN